MKSTFVLVAGFESVKLWTGLYKCFWLWKIYILDSLVCWSILLSSFFFRVVIFVKMCLCSSCLSCSVLHSWQLLCFSLLFSWLMAPGCKFFPPGYNKDLFIGWLIDLTSPGKISSVCLCSWFLFQILLRCNIFCDIETSKLRSYMLLNRIISVKCCFKNFGCLGCLWQENRVLNRYYCMWCELKIKTLFTTS